MTDRPKTNAATIPALTSVRFFPAVTVVFFHFGDAVFPFTGTSISEFFKLGYTAVSFFFFLSGFVLCYGYGRREVTYRTFIGARLARIYPLYLLAILTLLACSIPAKTFYEPNQLVTLITLLQSSLVMIQSWIPPQALSLNFPDWAVSNEFFFYLAFPIIVARLRKLSVRRIAWLAVTVYLAGQALVFFSAFVLFPSVRFPSMPHYFASYHPIFHLSTFISGVAFCLLYQNLSGTSFGGRSRWFSLLILFLVGGSIYAAASMPSVFKEQGIHPIILNNGLLAPLFAITIVAITKDSGPVGWLMQNRLLVLLGQASYAIYVFQYPVKRWIETIYPTLFDNKFGFYAYLSILIILSVLLFLLVETPLRRCCSKWQR